MVKVTKHQIIKILFYSELCHNKWLLLQEMKRQTIIKFLLTGFLSIKSLKMAVHQYLDIMFNGELIQKILGLI